MPQSKTVYDLPTGVTFFLVGLGIGAILALVLSPNVEGGALRDRRSTGNRELSAAL